MVAFSAANYLLIVVLSTAVAVATTTVVVAVVIGAVTVTTVTVTVAIAIADAVLTAIVFAATDIRTVASATVPSAATIIATFSAAAFS